MTGGERHDTGEAGGVSVGSEDEAWSNDDNNVHHIETIRVIAVDDRCAVRRLA